MSTKDWYHPGMRLTRLSPKNQITIPAAHLRQLGWRRGLSRLQIQRVGQMIQISPAQPSQTTHREQP